jgi:methylenetetrahydrofolate reductase (NADPH)
MPITSLPQIERVAALVGAAVPEWVVDRLHARGDDSAAVRTEGIAIAAELARDLLDAGAPGLHFFTLNRSTATLEVFDNLAL